MLRKPAILLLAALAAACGGNEAATPAADSADAALKAKADSNAARRNAATSPFAGVDTLAAAGERPLLRESFAYQGSGRDPFRSMISSTTTGPALGDLLLIAVLYDETNASNSVAVFRENGSNRRHTVHPGERIGRLYVAGMTRVSATLRFDDYGTVREQTYSLRPTEDEG